MAGLVSYGAYVPLYRLSLAEIARNWSGDPRPGEKAIRNGDEDSITMAVEAVLDCLTGIDRKTIDGLYFATTTSPYHEKQCASIIRAACDLREDILTADFTNSLKGGTDALRAAIHAVDSGAAKRVIVVAADGRPSAPDTEFEMAFGDGAAALLVGDSAPAVTIDASYSMASEFLDVWRRDTDRYPMSWEDRFIKDDGYQVLITKAVAALMKKANLTPKSFTKAVYYAPDARTHRAVAKPLGFDPKTQVQDPMFGALGNTGCAFGLMMLVAALEQAKPQNTILFANYGDGADAWALKVTDQIEKVRDRRGIKRHLAAKMMLSSYGKYIHFRDLMQWDYDRRPIRVAAVTAIWREHKAIYALYGQKCQSCGNIQFPKQRICMYCQARDKFDEVRLSDKRGKIFTFSKDERAVEVELPKILTIVDIDGGGRLYGALTDRDPAKVEVGTPVEFTFRKMFDSPDIHNYFWKVRPIRC